MPELVALWESLRDSGMAFLAINEDVKRVDAVRWLEANGLRPPVALAAVRRELRLGIESHHEHPAAAHQDPAASQARP